MYPNVEALRTLISQLIHLLISSSVSKKQREDFIQIHPWLEPCFIPDSSIRQNLMSLGRNWRHQIVFEDKSLHGKKTENPHVAIKVYVPGGAPELAAATTYFIFEQLPNESYEPIKVS